MWKRARVDNVIKGRDGRVRSCVLRLGGKELTRPIQLVISLEEIFNKKNKITELWLNENGSTKRKIWKTANEEISEIVCEWFVDAKSRSLPISGPILQAQAKDIAEKLGKTDFHASNGWLESFRKRHVISFKAFCGEAGDVSDDTLNTWIKKFQKLIKGYRPQNTANADSFRGLPKKIFMY
ncbi:Tigger transposable element-derived protein 4 [Araneus ventricosus]|uniref:Tigger transposable element-derived protein 4 n=1 Tax=Araneus ventricosus TaxID=182803 RepID=A0A4Y2MPB9_ARAVE|nr:Tigger transposable element-derived protein 4 [Araneus ventricosus]